MWLRPEGGIWPRGCIAALRVTFHDGYVSPIYGKSENTTRHEINFELGEIVTSCWAHKGEYTDSGNPIRISRLSFETNKGQDWAYGVPGSASANLLANSSGLLVGISGRCGDDIDRLVLWWVSALESISLDVRYLSTPDTSSIEPKTFAQLDADNRFSDVSLQAAINRSQVTSTSQSNSEGWSETLGVSVTQKISMFKIVEISGTLSFSATHSEQHSSTHTESETLSWTGTIVVPPREHYIVDLLYYTASFTLEFEATVTLQCKNGAWLSFKKPMKAWHTTAGVTKITPRKIPVGKSYEDEKLPEAEREVLL